MEPCDNTECDLQKTNDALHTELRKYIAVMQAILKTEAVGSETEKTDYLKKQGYTSALNHCKALILEVFPDIMNSEQEEVLIKPRTNEKAEVKEPKIKTITDIIDVIEHWELGYHLGRAVEKIIGAEHEGDVTKDLKKAIWYLERYLTAWHDERYLVDHNSNLE